MKVTILALHLGYGGIEKFISNIANMLSESHQVEIISIYKLYKTPPFYINEKVKIKYLMEDLKPNRDEFYNALKKFDVFGIIKQACIAAKILYLKRHLMKKQIEQLDCDVVISTIHPHNMLVSKYCKNSIKKIATEHNYKVEDKKYINKVVKSCKNMDYLVIASKKLSEIYKEKLLERKCKVVNIPLNIDNIPQVMSSLEEKNITFVGRLSKEKGVIDLIEVFKYVVEKEKDVTLNIIGDGDEKENIEKKIKDYNLEKNVILYGYRPKDQIEKILLNTSVGINTSYTESFGLAVLEMFSYGIPCVAFSSAEGVKEIIDDEKNGYIIDNRDCKSMAEKVVKLLNNDILRGKIGKNAREKSLQFDADNVKLYWEKLIV